jgi:hypothetical protein
MICITYMTYEIDHCSLLLDPLPTSLVKQEVTALTPVTTSIRNKSLESGSFPTSFKGAIVAPLLKKTSVDHDTTKTTGQCLTLHTNQVDWEGCSNTYTHIPQWKRFQSVYRRGHSTEIAFLRIHNDIVCAIGEQKAVLLLQLDLSAAFDTVDHTRLLHILQRPWNPRHCAHVVRGYVKATLPEILVVNYVFNLFIAIHNEGPDYINEVIVHINNLILCRNWTYLPWIDARVLVWHLKIAQEKSLIKCQN